MSQLPTRILKVCRYEGCFYFEKGWRVDGDDRFTGDMLEQATLCAVLKQRGSGLIEECPNWPDAVVEEATE